MSATGWIFQIGIRVLDVGLLVLFLFWMFRRMRDDDGGSEEDGPGGGGGGGRGPEGPPRGGGGSSRRRGSARQSAKRLRGQRGHERRVRYRGGQALPTPLPARVRRPRTPASPRRV